MNCLAGITLTSFIQNQVSSFLFSQTFRKEHGYFHKERSHGIEGQLEYYTEIFMVKPGDNQALGMALDAAAGVEPKSDDKCFCGSGRKYKKCHRPILRPFSKAGHDIIKFHNNLFKELIAKRK